MTHEEHRQRHVELHRCLDELYADYLNHNMPRPSDPTHRDFFPVGVNDLIVWSHKQTQDPDELPHD